MTGTASFGQPLEGRCVLVVEDQFLIADEMDRLVRALGGTVMGPAPSAAAVRRLIADGLPDLALLDINLHGEHVWDVAHELLARAVPMIFATGYEAALLRPPFENAIHIDKPVSARDLAEALSRLDKKLTQEVTP
jgi:CheY-like chemotaxis protein